VFRYLSCAVMLGLVCPLALEAQEFHSQCSNDNETYVLNGMDLITGKLTLTEISILSEGKMLCLNAMPFNLIQDSEMVVVSVQNGDVDCEQTAPADRIAAARLDGSPTHIIGKFSKLEQNKIILQNCQFEPM
jgi:hypothetical protein